MIKAHQNITIDETYPHHARALKIAGIAPKKFPTFKELENLRTTTMKEKRTERKKEKDKRRKRQTFCCIVVSQSLLRSSKHPPMHATIKKLRDKYNLKWLRVGMRCHKCPNLSLTVKLTKNVNSRDFGDLASNCNRASKINGLCMFGGECRKIIVVYKA